MQPGDRYSERWRYPHRCECVVVHADERTVIADVEHRCAPCFLPQAEALSGRIVYRREDFEIIFERMAEGAIALPASLELTI